MLNRNICNTCMGETREPPTLWRHKFLKLLIKYSQRPPALLPRKSPLCREYCKESHTNTCRGPPYSTDPVTMETWRAWTWRTGSSTRCHVMLAERTTILGHWIFYKFIPLGFPFLLLGHISLKEKRWDLHSTSVLCTYKNSGFVEDIFATVSTILPKRSECCDLKSRLCSNSDERTVDLKCHPGERTYSPCLRHSQCTGELLAVRVRSIVLFNRERTKDLFCQCSNLSACQVHHS